MIVPDAFINKQLFFTFILEGPAPPIQVINL